MANYAAFLRGVNLGPRRRVSAADLGSLFEQMGFRDVATFRSSGNVVFGAGRESAAKLTRRIERGLEPLGFDATVFVRTAAEMREIADHEPFDGGLVERSQGKLQVVLLPAEPSAAARREVLGLRTDDDRLAFRKRELYWLPSAGIRDSNLSFKAIDRIVGSTTVRTKGTMSELVAKYLAG
jgi:uncharacterized protein (DUF1697 family)